MSPPEAQLMPHDGSITASRSGAGLPRFASKSARRVVPLAPGYERGNWWLRFLGYLALWQPTTLLATDRNRQVGNPQAVVLSRIPSCGGEDSMRRVYHQARWKEHSQQRSERALRRRRISQTLRQAKTTTREISRPVHFLPDGRARLVAPQNLSVVGNIDEVLTFFEKLQRVANGAGQIFLDMSGVQEVTADAVLYLLSQLDLIRRRFGTAQVAGTLPRAKHARSLFTDSGFGNYVSLSESVKPENRDFLAVSSDKQVNTELAIEVVKFARSHLQKDRDVDTRALYVTLIECMTNTVQHAATGSGHIKWWLMAYYDADKRRVHFSFLDTGLGIPKTIHKKVYERVANATRNMLAHEYAHDGMLILSALKGEFRTRTGQKFRGKGLPKIYEAAMNNYVEELTVVARQGYVKCKEDSAKQLKSRFQGTLLSWVFC